MSVWFLGARDPRTRRVCEDCREVRNAWHVDCHTQAIPRHRCSRRRTLGCGTPKARSSGTPLQAHKNLTSAMWMALQSIHLTLPVQHRSVHEIHSVTPRFSPRPWLHTRRNTRGSLRKSSTRRARSRTRACPRGATARRRTTACRGSCRAASSNRSTRTSARASASACCSRTGSDSRIRTGQRSASTCSCSRARCSTPSTSFSTDNRGLVLDALRTSQRLCGPRTHEQRTPAPGR